MNIEMHISFWICVFIFFREIPRSRIPGFYDGSIFNFLRTLRTVFRSDYANLLLTVHEGSLFSISLSTFVISWLFDDSHSNRCEMKNLIVVLIFISLMISDVEQLFLWLPAVCMSSLEKCLVRSSSHFLIRLLIFYILSYINSLYIWDINSLSDISFTDVLFHSTDHLFVLFMVSFPVQVFRFCVLLLQSHFFLVPIMETQNIYTLDFHSLPTTSTDLEPNILIYPVVHILRETLTHICHLSHWLDFSQCLFCSLNLPIQFEFCQCIFSPLSYPVAFCSFAFLSVCCISSLVAYTELY